MKPSPLNLEFFYVEALRWKVEPGFNPDKATPLTVGDLKEELDRAESEGPRQAAYRLKLALPPSEGRFPYSFEIVLIGFFSVAEHVPDEQVDVVLIGNAPAVLYSSAREVLAASLGRGPFRPLLLPAVHFLDLLPPRPTVAPVTKELPAAPAKTRRAPAKSKRKSDENE